MRSLLSCCALAALLAAPAFAGTVEAPTIEGKYVESRSCNVYIGQCFANGEMGNSGTEATLAWNVTRGSWNGVRLDGLKVVAVTRAQTTLGDTTKNPYPTTSVLIVDAKADAVQHAALVALAKELGGELIDDIAKIESAPITFEMKPECTAGGCSSLKAGDTLQLDTRCLNEGDKHCVNDKAFYPPLTKVENAKVLHAERDRFSGKGLGVTWDTDVRSSAYLATFSR